MDTIDLLKKRAATFAERNEFHVNDIVEWKPGMQNRRAEGPFIVTEVLSEPILDNAQDSGSPYFREPLDTTLGLVDGEGDFLCLHYDSRRIRPVSRDDVE